MKTVSDLYNKFKNIGKSCVVLGCGKSARDFKPHPKIFSIGVNDIGLIHNPDMLFIVDKKKKFLIDSGKEGTSRIDSIEKTISSFYVVADNEWNFAQEKKYTFVLGTMYNLTTNLDNSNKINYANDSPYMAILLAYKLGFRNIAILGVDYTPHHFYADDGDHQLIRLNMKEKVLNQYGSLKRNLTGVNLYNLSKDSIITSFPKISYDDFIYKTL